jgi:serine protease DegQ
MRRLWLLFAQTVTVGLAILFIVTTLKPEWAAAMLGSNRLHTTTSVPMLEAPPNTAPVQNSYRAAAAHAMPSVVNVFTSKTPPRPQNPLLNDPFFRKFFGDRFDDPDEKQISLGSGVIVSPHGYILTNNHVVEAAEEIEVALADGRKASAKVVGADPETDLAVIKIDLDNLPAITLGRVEDARVGDVVLAIGNPFGVGQTVTMGIISALGRNHLGILDAFENFIQTDAAINPGNSGGALIDANGNLLGINTAIYSRSGGSLGIGFAIPVTTVKSVMDAIIKDGQVIRGYIGVEPQDITPELAESFGLKKSNGAIIAGVLKGGPADKAGIRPGDILVSVNDKPVVDMSEMLNDIAQLKPGSKAKIVVLRNNQEASYTVIVGKRPKAQPRPMDEDQE